MHVHISVQTRRLVITTYNTRVISYIYTHASVLYYLFGQRYCSFSLNGTSPTNNYTRVSIELFSPGHPYFSRFEFVPYARVVRPAYEDVSASRWRLFVLNGDFRVFDTRRLFMISYIYTPIAVRK